jgi:hypothetical protein
MKNVILHNDCSVLENTGKDEDEKRSTSETGLTFSGVLAGF